MDLARLAHEALLNCRDQFQGLNGQAPLFCAVTGVLQLLKVGEAHKRRGEIRVRQDES